MKLIHAIFFGIFILILAYLGFTNAAGVAGITAAGSGALTGETKVLQGR